MEQDYIFISEYQMPDGFIKFAHTDKTVLSAANGNSQSATEYIWTNERTWEHLPERMKEVSRLSNGTQMNIMDFMEE